MTSHPTGTSSTWTQSLFDSITEDTSSSPEKNSGKILPGLESDPIYGPTRKDLDLVHAGWFLEDLGEYCEIYKELGTPIALDVEFLVVGSTKVIWPDQESDEDQ